MQNLPNWFNGIANQYFSEILGRQSGMPNLRYLQIGVFSGDASEWLLKNVLTHDSSHLTDVDTWEGSKEEEMSKIDFRQVEKLYDARMLQYGKKVSKVKSKSLDYLEKAPKDYFDFIYIDADHRAGAVLLDATLSWSLLKVGGIIAFDDWAWDKDEDQLNTPMIGINAFIGARYGKYKMISGGLQIWVQKVMA